MNITKKKNKNKKALALASLSLVTVLGGTLAYFNTNSNIVNTFKSAIYQNKIEEVFESPTNWTPGTTTEKQVYVTNTGNTDMAIRATYTEKWTDANGEELPLESDGERAALINCNEDWLMNSDGYFYYGSKDNLKKLEPNAKSTSFIRSVTFNDNITANLTETVSEDGKTITYQSDGTGYDNATYKLIVNIETVQYDQANSIWN